MESKEPIIMFDSPEAAEFKTVALTGWWSSKGVFYKDDERMARYGGSTHKACEQCGKPTVKHRLVCEECLIPKEIEKYFAMPMKPWDQEVPVYSRVHDVYLNYICELRDYCNETDTNPNLMQLVIAEPEFAKEIYPNEHYVDDLPEDCEVPIEIADAFEILNKAIKACKEPLCFYPGKFRPTPESIDIGGNDD